MTTRRDKRDTSACVRCGLVRVTRADRSHYCRDCMRAASTGGNAWMEHGACRAPHYDAEWWWPASGTDPMTPNALLICHACKVRDLCLDYAVQHKETDGIWGGTMPEDRRRMIARQRKAVS